MNDRSTIRRGSRHNLTLDEYNTGGTRALYAAKGSDLPHAKLNETLVRQIRTLHAEKERIKKELDAKYSSKALGKRFQVHTHTIDKIIRRQTWAHVRD